MGVEVAATVVNSVDPTWVGAMLFTYPIQFIIWTAMVAIAAFCFGFAWEKRKVGIAKAEADLMKTQHDIDVETMRSIHDLNKKLMEEANESRKILIKTYEESKQLMDVSRQIQQENIQIHELNKVLANENRKLTQEIEKVKLEEEME